MTTTFEITRGMRVKQKRTKRVGNVRLVHPPREDGKASALVAWTNGATTSVFLDTLEPAGPPMARIALSVRVDDEAKLREAAKAIGREVYFDELRYVGLPVDHVVAEVIDHLFSQDHQRLGDYGLGVEAARPYQQGFNHNFAE